MLGGLPRRPHAYGYPFPGPRRESAPQQGQRLGAQTLGANLS